MNVDKGYYKIISDLIQEENNVIHKVYQKMLVIKVREIFYAPSESVLNV